MRVEECCHALLAQMLPEVDRDRMGIAVDIGVGTFAFYCELFDELRFPTIAVEPLPGDKLKQLCESRDIPLIEACISDVDGFVDIYAGNFQGKEDPNLNSMRADWWGSTATARQVPSRTLFNLLSGAEAHRITCMKLDVEGMEYPIIKQFLDLQESLLPQVLVFEYGGGGTRESGEGGWSEELLGETMNSFEILRRLGYSQTMVIDSAAGTSEQVLALEAIELEPVAIFPPQSVYGNIITLRGAWWDEARISSICQPYRENEMASSSLRGPNNLLKRIARKVRHVLYQ